MRCAGVAAARAGATTGEWAGTLREVFGEYRAPTGVTGAVVAATRAEDRLILSGVTDDIANLGSKNDSWLKWIWQSLELHERRANDVIDLGDDVKLQLTINLADEPPDDFDAARDKSHFAGAEFLNQHGLGCEDPELVDFVILHWYPGGGIGVDQRPERDTAVGHARGIGMSDGKTIAANLEEASVTGRQKK